MLTQTKLENLDDYFVDLGRRKNKGVFFYRINGYNTLIHEFIRRYYEAARLSGVIIEGKLQNPDSNHLSYYNDIVGMDFQLSMDFISSRLTKWLPRMDHSQRDNVAGAIYDTLIGLQQAGKNDNMLKNAYIKFMCWLYYKFQRIVDQLGAEKLPKILYEGSVSTYELLLMQTLSRAGCDIVLLQYRGDGEYRKVDAESAMSAALELPGMEAFPQDFSLKRIRQELQDEEDTRRLYGVRPQVTNCTNAWMTGKVLEDVRADAAARGGNPAFFYNCFCRVAGVEDKVTYQNDLYQLQSDLRHAGRRVVIVNQLTPPSPEEINRIHRCGYQNLHQLIMDLSKNLRWTGNQELQRLMTKAFVDLMLEEGQKENALNRLTNKAVYLLCWLKRFQQQLFSGWMMPEISCFFYMGGCRNGNEALFCSFLARLPVDVVIFTPNPDRKCCLEDPLLYESHFPYSLDISVYPEDGASLRAGTAAYHAERELDSIMYQDSGLFRNQQYGKANTITLQTMFEEIPILWNQELKYRPYFSTANNIVNMPVIFSKISGVKDGIAANYWVTIKSLMTPETVLITSAPNITPSAENPIRAHAVEFFKNGKLQRERIKNHRAYRYTFLREPMQDYLLDKLQLLIDQRLIRGTFETGTEYTIVSVALNLEKDILRMLQKFDFTRKNPKLIYVSTGETVLSLEDAIFAAFMNLVGFDIVFFVPTGYQCVERFLDNSTLEEHQIGEYLYDLQVPDFNTIASNQRLSWRERLFGRGV